MRAGRVTRIVLLVLVAALSVGQTAGAEDFNAQRMLFLRNDGDCGANAHPFLANAPGRTDLNCGYIGGGPFGEAFAAVGVDTAKIYATEFPLNLTLDASRNVTGVIAVSPYVRGPNGAGSGVGQIVVDLVATGALADGTPVELGSLTQTVTANPVISRQEIPFSIDVADAADRAVLDQFSLSVKIRGVHAAHGFNELNGSSFLRLPFHRAPAEAPAS